MILCAGRSPLLLIQPQVVHVTYHQCRVGYKQVLNNSEAFVFSQQRGPGVVTLMHIHY